MFVGERVESGRDRPITALDTRLSIWDSVGSQCWYHSFTEKPLGILPPTTRIGKLQMSKERDSESERGALKPKPQTEQAPSKPPERAGTCWGLGAHQGRRAQGDRLDIRNCDHTWALLAQWMFYETLLWARLDHRLRTWVNKA